MFQGVLRVPGMTVRNATTWVGVLAVALAGGLLLNVPMSQAAPVVADDDEEAFGATTVKWTSSFEDLDYELGTTVTFDITWNVLTGVASLDKDEPFAPRFPFFTPKDPFDPVEGEMEMVSSDADARTVTVKVTFTALHFSEEEMSDKGNAHMSIFLFVDEDGDGAAETRVQLGVNLHVEDPESQGDRQTPGPGEDRPGPDVGRPSEGPGAADPPGPPSWVPDFVQEIWTRLWERLRALFG